MEGELNLQIKSREDSTRDGCEWMNYLKDTSVDTPSVPSECVAEVQGQGKQIPLNVGDIHQNIEGTGLRELQVQHSIEARTICVEMEIADNAHTELGVSGRTLGPSIPTVTEILWQSTMVGKREWKSLEKSVQNADSEILDDKSSYLNTNEFGNRGFGSLVLKDRLKDWIDSTAPLARRLTSAAAVKAGSTVPGIVKFWWDKNKPARSPTVPEVHSYDDRDNNSSSQRENPGAEVQSKICPKETSELDPSIFKGKQGEQIMQELSRSLRQVLGEAVKGEGKSVGDGLYALGVLCALIEQALAFGVKDGNRSRWSPWLAGKSSPSVFSMLGALELSLPLYSVVENQPTRSSLGLDAVRSLSWVKTDAGRLRAWIRQSLNSKLLALRLRIVCGQPTLIEQWYETWGLLRLEEKADELLSISMALNAIHINLLVMPCVALDSQKVIFSEHRSSTIHAGEASSPLSAVGHGISRKSEAVDCRPSLYPLSSGELQHDDINTSFVLEKRNKLRKKACSKKRVVSMVEAESGSPERISSKSGIDAVSSTSKDSDPPCRVINALEGLLGHEEFQSLVSEKNVTVHAEEVEVAPPEEKEIKLYDIGSKENAAGNMSMEVDNEENQGSKESKDDLKGKEVDTEGSSAIEPEMNIKWVVTKDSWNQDSFRSVEEFHDQGSREEGSGSRSEYNSLTDTGTDDDASPISGERPLNFHLEVQKSSSNCGGFFDNFEDELAFGGSDWSEYLHENGIGLDAFVELQESKRKYDLEKELSMHDILSGVNVGAVSEFEDNTNGDSLRGGVPPILGAGRPDLDDGEDEFVVSETESVTSCPLPDASPSLDCQSACREGRFGSDKMVSSAQSHMVGDIPDPWDFAPGNNLESLNEDADRILTKGHGQVDLHTQEELMFGFAERAIEDLQAAVDVEVLVSHGRKVSDGSELLVSRSFTQNPLEKVPVAESEISVITESPQDELAERLAGISNSELEMDNKQCGDKIVQVHHQDDFHDDTAIDMFLDDDFRKKGRIMRLGSKKAEELLQMNFSNLGKAVYSPGKVALKGPSTEEYKRAGVDWATDDLGPDELSRYVEALEVKETYIDTVLDMEDVLFDGEGGKGGRLIQMSPGAVRPMRDGSLSASTSTTSALASRQLQQSTITSTEVDWVEVVGAVQRRGGASLGERVVGIKEHTVYRLRVKGGSNEWDIQRRYRDFVVLYSRLQGFAQNKNVLLPPPWERVKQESRKYFGNTSPNVVEIRSVLIQVCLQSLLKAGPPLSTATPLLRFLFPVGEVSHYGLTSDKASGPRIINSQLDSTLPLEDFGLSHQYSPKSDSSSSLAEQEDDKAQISVLGKTIRLIVEIHKKKSLKQQLQAQHYTCAGCYKDLELALGLVPELVQNWGWSGPRLCEYSGQVFCSTCHLNETAVLPAWVLQRWDFAPRQVSQLAKAYLDSIFDKPMLCVSAVNPYLYARVPVLAHLTDIRRKVSRMLACIRCPARGRVQTMLGSRHYLLENNDFFALRDLADLSKGAFAVLPGFMRAVSVKLLSHITRECSICRELGDACGAQQLCDDPFDMIFPYQEDNITRCKLCQAPFHKRCFRKCLTCPACRGQSVQMFKDSQQSIGHSLQQDTMESDLTINSSPSGVLESMESPSSSLIIPHEKKVKAKRNLLANYLTLKEAESSEHAKDKRNSIVLNMSALVSTVEL